MNRIHRPELDTDDHQWFDLEDDDGRPAGSVQVRRSPAEKTARALVRNLADDVPLIVAGPAWDALTANQKDNRLRAVVERLVRLELRRQDAS